MTDQHFKEYVHTISKTLNMSLPTMARLLKLEERRLYQYNMPSRQKKAICHRLKGMVMRRVKKHRHSVLTSKQIEEVKKQKIKIQTVYKRLERGWDVHEAIYTPVVRTITKEQREQARKNGLGMDVVYKRLQCGWAVESAITIPVNAHHAFTEEEMKIAKENGIKPTTLRSRFFTLGWDIEKCIHTPVKKRKKS